MADAAYNTNPSGASPPDAPLRTAHAELRRALIGMHVPTVPPYPVPDDIEAIGDYVREVVAAFDAWHLAVGRELNSSVTFNVDLSLFEEAFARATEGLSQYEISSAAEALREDLAEEAADR